MIFGPAQSLRGLNLTTELISSSFFLYYDLIFRVENLYVILNRYISKL